VGLQAASSRRRGGHDASRLHDLFDGNPLIGRRAPGGCRRGHRGWPRLGFMHQQAHVGSVRCATSSVGHESWACAARRCREGGKIRVNLEASNCPPYHSSAVGAHSASRHVAPHRRAPRRIGGRTVDGGHATGTATRLRTPARPDVDDHEPERTRPMLGRRRSGSPGTAEGPADSAPAPAAGAAPRRLRTSRWRWTPS